MQDSRQLFGELHKGSKSSSLYPETNTQQKISQLTPQLGLFECFPELEGINHPIHTALRKRLLLPRWLVLGVLASQVPKMGFLESLVSPFTQRPHVSPPPLPQKQALLILQIWSALSFAFFGMQDTKTQKIKLDVSHIFKGSPEQVADDCRFVETFFSQPFCVKIAPDDYPMQGSKKKSAASCSVNLVKQVYFDFSECLSLNILLSVSLEDFILGTNLFEETFDRLGHAYSYFSWQMHSSFVSLNPDVIFGIGKSHWKKIFFYLLLEVRKFNSLGDVKHEGLWQFTEHKKYDLSLWNKDLMSLFLLLYDHGILGWDRELPKSRVRHLKSATSDVVVAWRASQQLEVALNLEKTINELKCPTASVHQLSGNSNALRSPQDFTSTPVEKKLEFKESNVNHSVTLNRNLVPTSTVSGLSISLAAPILEKRTDELPLDDFWKLVSSFENTLGPAQRVAFQNEKERRTSEEFRKYFDPVLQSLLKRSR